MDTEDKDEERVSEGKKEGEERGERIEKVEFNESILVLFNEELRDSTVDGVELVTGVTAANGLSSGRGTDINDDDEIAITVSLSVATGIYVDAFVNIEVLFGTENQDEVLVALLDVVLVKFIIKLDVGRGVDARLVDGIATEGKTLLLAGGKQFCDCALQNTLTGWPELRTRNIT